CTSLTYHGARVFRYLLCVLHRLAKHGEDHFIGQIQVTVVWRVHVRRNCPARLCSRKLGETSNEIVPHSTPRPGASYPIRCTLPWTVHHALRQWPSSAMSIPRLSPAGAGHASVDARSGLGG